ncbi:MAG: DNA-directed RNA polymerase subunit omega [Thermoguttaceae bacterium]|nr:DNA-directed RNA polymerase subunit omega [Thermoguttaceae bacterium]
MIDELRDEKLIEKVGGRFQLSALIQKRLVYLNKGAASFVESDGSKSKLELVIQEIVEDKIYLDTDGNLRYHDGTSPEPLASDAPGEDFSFDSDSGPVFSPEGD